MSEQKREDENREVKICFMTMNEILNEITAENIYDFNSRNSSELESWFKTGYFFLLFQFFLF